MLQGDGQISIGTIGPIDCAAVASDDHNMLAALQRREGESLADLLQRLDDVTERARRGADAGGLLGPLESEASTTERDLIVGNARRREAVDRLRSAAGRILRASPELKRLLDNAGARVVSDRAGTAPEVSR